MTGFRIRYGSTKVTQQMKKVNANNLMAHTSPSFFTNVINHSFNASKIFFAISRYCHIPPATFLN